MNSFYRVRNGRVAAGLTTVLLAGALGISSLSLAQGSSGEAVRSSGRGLTAFKSDAELRAYLLRLRRAQQRVEDVMVPMPAPPALEAPPPPAAEASASTEAGAVVVTGSRVAAPPGITNNQTVGVDEGGIVKVRGDTLVILRRGRLFTVSLAGGGMRPIDSINAFPPGVSGQGDWYDEMLISGDRVIVVGYSYARGGTEINRFRLDAAGRLRFEDAHHLRSNDYYSSRNYASRLMGNKLIYYTPLYLGGGRDPLDAFPGIRRWQGGTGKSAFRRIGSARQVYIPPAMRSGRGVNIEALHSVMTCDLTAVVLDCDAVGILGPASRTFYVSADAVYLWISDAWRNDPRRGAASSYIYRLPFGKRERPSAIAARGAPVDQFSFREDAADDVLNVLVRSQGGDDAMFRPEFSEGEVALLRVPLRDFGDGSREASRTRYRWLPSPGADTYSFHNRFVGNHILYGGSSDGARRGAPPGVVVAAPLQGGRVAQLPLPHGITRIEALGRDGLVVGAGDGDLSFSAVDLAGSSARLGDRYTLPAASEGESRSHAFFFSPATADGRTGIMGLPVARAAAPEYRRFFGSSAAMLFLHRLDRRFAPAGELAANPQGTADDGCQASCVDWYGNARPIFLGERTFALLGYELVEGKLGNRRISEVARVNFAPPPRAGSR